MSESKIYNPDGTFTDEWNGYLNLIDPKIIKLVDEAVEWLDLMNAPAMDYKLLDDALISILRLHAHTVWVKRVAKFHTSEDGES
ncbi:MAG: hypothetical protein AAFR81_04030 [Chloroflexota bacterium]